MKSQKSKDNKFVIYISKRDIDGTIFVVKQEPFTIKFSLKPTSEVDLLDPGRVIYLRVKTDNKEYSYKSKFFKIHGHEMNHLSIENGVDLWKFTLTCIRLYE